MQYMLLVWEHWWIITDIIQIYTVVFCCSHVLHNTLCLLKSASFLCYGVHACASILKNFTILYTLLYFSVAQISPVCVDGNRLECAHCIQIKSFNLCH